MGEDLRLDEEVAESRMQRVRGRRCKDDLRVTRNVDHSARPAAVGDRDPAQFDIILRRDGDLRMRVEVVVAAAELRSSAREDRFVGVRPFERRLIRRRPELPARRVAQVAECTPIVAGAVFAPACHRDVLPAAVTAAPVRDHHVVSAVRQKLHLRYRGVGGAENPDRHFLAEGSRPQFGELGGARKERRSLRNPLLKQQHCCLEFRVRPESLLHRTVQEQIGQREEAHALVMCQEGPDHDTGLAASLTGRGIVDGFKEAVFPDVPLGSEALQIPARLLGRHHQCKHRGVRRDDQIVREAAFEPQARNAERAILVVEMNVDRIIAGFRHAPWHAELPPILDLPLDGRLAGPVEQRIFVRRHHQERHEVFEHRTTPRKENRFSTGAREQTPQGKPVFLRQLSLSNRHETAESRFRSQQIVETRVPPALTHVVPDGQ